MSKFQPYKIVHVHLEKPLEEVGLFPLEAGTRFYCVFWWKEIPLGHLFIEPGTLLAKNELRATVVSVIEPVIDAYLQGRVNDKQYKSAFITGNHQAFMHRMETIFSDYTPHDLPAWLDISVVICTRNRSGYLKRCLESLGTLKCAPSEIIVVDNAPTDESTRKVVEHFDGVTYCREPRAGLDIARNTGAKKASYSIVAYIDDDVILHPLWSYQVWKAFEDPAIAAMTGLVIASSLDTESQQTFEKYWSFNRGYKETLYNQGFFRKSLQSGPPVWEIGAGANMAFRKSIFSKVGYFDERLDVGAAGCSGDSEIWFRILARGYEIFYCPRAVVYHEHRKQLEALNKQLFNYMRGFAAAALIQQEQNELAGYRKHLFHEMPIYYLRLLAKGFPLYHSRYRTLFSEISGFISGIVYFWKSHSKPSHIHSYQRKSQNPIY